MTGPSDRPGSDSNVLPSGSEVPPSSVGPFVGECPLGAGHWKLVDLSNAEVRQLTAFLNGAIMDSGVRHHLWRSWGLCERHGWAYAVLEIEVNGGRPFSTTILLADLMVRAVRLMRRTRRLPWPVPLHRLRVGAKCFTCEFVAMIARVNGAFPASEESAAGGQTTRFTALLKSSEALWRPLACPACGGGRGPLCRPHLLAGRPPGLREEMERYLSGLSGRLETYLRSMTWRGPVASELEGVAWIEALGWFYGWRTPLSAVEDG